MTTHRTEVKSAYKLALARRDGLKHRPTEVEKALVAEGCQAYLRAFKDFLHPTPYVGVNMSIASCIRMFNHGAWLNIYEAIQLETGLRGRALMAEARQRLQTRGRDYFERRVAFERFFGFGPNTHYGA